MRYFEINAFSSEPFKGNPAGVCFIEQKIDDFLMQKIAQQNNLSETAFIEKLSDNLWKIRFFTPNGEVDLCGHATIGSAHAISLISDVKEINFQANKNLIKVTKDGAKYQMEFPLWIGEKIEIDFHQKKTGFLKRDLLIEFDSEEEVLYYKPDYQQISQLPGLGLIITAKGKEVDFVSRCFYPKLDVWEDPVTGSAHSMLAPFWSQKLNKKQLCAKQISTRGGDLECLVLDDSVLISGFANLYLQSEIDIS